MQKAVLNIKKLKVTQGMNGAYSHQGVLAIDIGKDCEYLKAPFTGVIKRIYSSCNAVWLESKSKVKYADGTEDYMTVLTMHDNNVSNLKVGQEIKQNTIYYQPGTKGKVTGSHIHMTVGKGKFTGKGWYRNDKGQWCVNNQYPINKALFLYKNVIVEKDGGYKWTTTSNFTYEPTKYLNLEPTVKSWAVYKTAKYFDPDKEEDILIRLNPHKFGGLSYKIYQDVGNYHFRIKTHDKGYGYIAGNPHKYDCTITVKPRYENGEY